MKYYRVHTGTRIDRYNPRTGWSQYRTRKEVTYDDSDLGIIPDGKMAGVMCFALPKVAYPYTFISVPQKHVTITERRIIG